eukprot:COSAG01_NODE_10560_length_2132_cov_129.550910_3_plen_160_part_00
MATFISSKRVSGSWRGCGVDRAQLPRAESVILVLPGVVADFCVGDWAPAGGVAHLLRPKAREDGTLLLDGSALAFEQKARCKQALERARKRCEESGESLPPPPCTMAKVEKVTGKSPRVAAAPPLQMAAGPDGSRGFSMRCTALVLQEEADELLWFTDP